MCHKSFCLIALLIFVFSGVAQARDTKHHFLIEDALSSSTGQETLNAGVEFYFGSQKHANIIKSLGEDFTNKKTNAFNKDDTTACEWVFLSALIQLQEKAQQLGANAVVNIHSYYKKAPFFSETEYECHAGGIIAGVALKGTFVKLGSGASSNYNSVKTESTKGYNQQVKEVQRALTVKGYEPGPVDGYMGTKTSEAIKSFQADNGLTVTGKLDSSTVSALRGTESGEASGGESNSENHVTAQNKCTVEQILELQKVGLTAEQISSACDT